MPPLDARPQVQRVVIVSRRLSIVAALVPLTLKRVAAAQAVDRQRFDVAVVDLDGTAGRLGADAARRSA